MERKTGIHFIFFHSSGSASIHPRHVILISGMKALIQIFLLVLLLGCASPYYPVYVSSEGDYYFAERASNGPYYGSDSMMFSDIGLYPWWAGSYPPLTFVYFSPNFYPHYFSVWYPPGYVDTKGSPVLPPVAYSGQPVANPDLWKSIDRVAVNREIVNRRMIGQKAALSKRSAPAYTRSTLPASATTGSAGFGRSSSRSGSTSSGRLGSSRSSDLHDQ